MALYYQYVAYKFFTSKLNSAGRSHSGSLFTTEEQEKKKEKKKKKGWLMTLPPFMRTLFTR